MSIEFKPVKIDKEAAARHLERETYGEVLPEDEAENIDYSLTEDYDKSEYEKLTRSSTPFNEREIVERCMANRTPEQIREAEEMYKEYEKYMPKNEGE